jgi:hypothetical protein
VEFSLIINALQYPPGMTDFIKNTIGNIPRIVKHELHVGFYLDSMVLPQIDPPFLEHEISVTFAKHETDQ